MKSADLLAILDFLYHGEANIYQENLDTFLVIAEELKLKGLTGGIEDFKESNNASNLENKCVIMEKQKIHEALIINEKDMKTTKQEVASVFQENTQDISIVLQEQIYSSHMQDFDATIKSNFELITRDGKIIYICNLCGKKALFDTQMRNHIEANHLEGVVHSCNFCEKIFRTRNGLGQHCSLCHKI